MESVPPSSRALTSAAVRVGSDDHKRAAAPATEPGQGGVGPPEGYGEVLLEVGRALVVVGRRHPGGPGMVQVFKGGDAVPGPGGAGNLRGRVVDSPVHPVSPDPIVADPAD